MRLPSILTKAKTPQPWRSALEAKRREIDADLTALRRILARDEAPPPTSVALPKEAVATNGARIPARRGDAEREILEMLTDRRIHRPAEIGAIRGTTSNAASNVLRRLLEKELVVTDGRGGYALPPGDEQSSLSETERDTQRAEGGGS